MRARAPTTTILRTPINRSFAARAVLTSAQQQGPSFLQRSAQSGTLGHYTTERTARADENLCSRARPVPARRFTRAPVDQGKSQQRQQMDGSLAAGQGPSKTHVRFCALPAAQFCKPQSAVRSPGSVSGRTLRWRSATQPDWGSPRDAWKQVPVVSFRKATVIRIRDARFSAESVRSAPCRFDRDRQNAPADSLFLPRPDDEQAKEETAGAEDESVRHDQTGGQQRQRHRVVELTRVTTRTARNV